MASTTVGFAQISDENSHAADPASKGDKELSAEYDQIIAGLRETYKSGATVPIKARIRVINQIKTLTREQEAICAAIWEDHRRPKTLAVLTDISPSLQECSRMKRGIRSWAKMKREQGSWLTYPAKFYSKYEPKGVVLIISPWNFPFLLSFAPILNAVAAGNTVLLKPSEVSTSCESLLMRLIPKYLDPNWVRVVKGAVRETGILLKKRYDHILYTGNGFVGRIVMRAAAEHLTPVTLELGGKSPVYVDKKCNMAVAARRLASTKIYCTGQICLAPDYTLVHEEIADEFIALLLRTLDTMLGEKGHGEEQFSNDAGRIINKRHFDRVKALLEGEHHGEVIRGGLEKADRDDRFIPLTIIKNPDDDSRVMTEEIFGPIMPIKIVKGPQEAVDFINAREKPLALYVFSTNKTVQNLFRLYTSSGSLVMNDAVVQGLTANTPFGGIGEAGMGSYRGKNGFVEFSHKRAVMYKPNWIELAFLRYPPFNERRLVKLLGVINKIL